MTSSGTARSWWKLQSHLIPRRPQSRRRASRGAAGQGRSSSQVRLEKHVDRLEIRTLLATFSVTTLLDNTDGGDGEISLREAISMANANDPSEVDEVVVPEGIYTLTRTGADDNNVDGDLDITGPTLIRGAGPGLTVISAGGGSGIGERVLHIVGGFDVTIQSLTLSSGRNDNGAGLSVAGTGGSSVALHSVQLTDNVATDHGGAIAVAADASLTATETIVSGNSAPRGGGIATFGMLTLLSSTIADNISGGLGGGLHIEGSMANARVVSSTVSGNGAFNGGGITNINGTLAVVNSTISGNTTSGVSGAISSTAGGAGGSATAVIVQTTIANNQQGSGGAVHTIVQNSATSALLQIGNSILVNNTGGDGNLSQQGVGAVITSLDGNLADDTGSGRLIEANDQTNVMAPVINATLSNNGGPTLTHALATNSPAIDAGDNNNARDPGSDGILQLADPVLVTDQRGAVFARIEGGRVDIGAVEISSLIDYGDAPDPLPGTGTGNYRTRSDDSGARHHVVDGLFLGDSVEGLDSGQQQNVAANADDIAANGLPDDEDGVLDPFGLIATEGTAPVVTLLATNTTGSDAMLSGWIDSNHDGVFDNATERAQITVAGATTDGRFELTFPTLAIGSAGRTYARFRLSTDAAAANSTGTADDGEVEDYVFTIIAQNTATAKSQQKISDGIGGFADGTLEQRDYFGSAVTSLGDLDGDGIPDMAVGARRDEPVSEPGADPGHGVVYVLLMNSDGTVKSRQKIANGIGGLASDTVERGEYFGSALASPGDLDGDGIPDLAVGAMRDGNNDFQEGAVHILLMHSDGTVRSQQKISDGIGGLDDGTLDLADNFGSSVAGLGDLNGDGVPDIAVGARRDVVDTALEGSLYILMLDRDGRVKSQQQIGDGVGGLAPGTLGHRDYFGSAVTSVGDLDGDGVQDIAVGAVGDNSVHVLHLNADGTVKDQRQLHGRDGFGESVAGVGDLDGDGVGDLVVGATRDDGRVYGGQGAVLVQFLRPNGTARSGLRISDGNGGLRLGTLDLHDRFGSAVTSLGDLDGDGIPELAVGAIGDEAVDDENEGAVYVLFLAAEFDYGDAPDSYDTTAASDGARHVPTGPTLGTARDADDNARTPLDGTGDDADSDDEDGVVFVTPLQAGGIARVEVLASEPGLLNAWVDITGDGTWGDAGEQIFVDQPVVAGLNVLTFAVPDVVTTGPSFARFRLNTAGGLSFDGPAADGEVEDYPVIISMAAALDSDGNGQADLFTDGILIVRFMAGFRGQALVENATADDATRTDASAVEGFLSTVFDSFDVDVNGETQLFTDGALIARYLAGFRGAALTTGAIGSGATRTDPQAIADYLDTLRPTVSGVLSATASGLLSARAPSTSHGVSQVDDDQKQAESVPVPHEGRVEISFEVISPRSTQRGGPVSPSLWTESRLRVKSIDRAFEDPLELFGSPWML